MNKEYPFYFLKIIVAALGVIFCENSFASTKYQPATQIVLNDTRETLINPKASYKSDISYLYADLKYRDNELKICEFGPARRASIAGSKVVYNGKTISIPTPYWPLMWEYVARLSVPVWSIGPVATHFEKAVPEVDCFDSLEQLERAQKFIQRKKSHKDGLALSYSGIVVYTHINRYNPARKQLRAAFMKRHPDILFFDGAAHLYANNKLELARLLDRADLRDFKPRWKMYKKNIHPNLHEKF